MVQRTYHGWPPFAHAGRPLHSTNQGRRPTGAAIAMMQFDTMQKFGKDGADAVLKSFGALSKGAQTAAVETADFAKRSFEQGSATAEKLVGVRTMDRAMEIQGEFLRMSYEGLVAQATKMGELAANTVKEAYAPVEGLVAKTAPQAA